MHIPMAKSFKHKPDSCMEPQQDVSSPFISLESLNSLIESGSKGLKIFDCTTGPNALEGFAKETIPGAKFLKINDLHEPEAKYQFTFPNEEHFIKFAKQIGAAKSDKIVIFEQAMTGFHARVWFVLKAFGHGDVHVLNGSLQAWKQAGFKTTTDNHGAYKTDESADYSYKLNSKLIASFDEVLDIAKEKKGVPQLLDSRSPADYKGDNQLAPGVRKGHIPGAINVFARKFIDDNGKLIKEDKEEIKKTFESSGISLDKPIISYCNKGVAATINVLLLDYAGHDLNNVKLYDGSWAEFGSREESKDLVEI